MGKLLKITGTAVVYFCVATVISLFAGAGVIWSRGYLSQDRMLDLLLTIHDLPTSASNDTQGEQKEDPQVAYGKMLKERVLDSQDLVSRTGTLDAAMAEVLLLQGRLNESRRQYREMLAQFETRLGEMRAGAQNRAMQDVQTILGTLEPAQTNEQLLRMMEDGRDDVVVEVLKSMPADRRKKITAVMAEDDEKFYKIIEKILTGDAASNSNGTGNEIGDVAEQQT